MIFAIVVIVVVLVAGMIMAGERALDKKRNPEKYKAIAEVESRPRIKLAYVSGHPALQERINVYLSLHKTHLQMYPLPPTFGYKEVPPVMASIPITAIKDIVVKDESTAGYETTANRFMMIGTLALALKKKIVNEVAVLIISWDDGHTHYQTCFKKTGTAAVTDMNNAKSTLMEWMRQSEQVS